MGADAALQPDHECADAFADFCSTYANEIRAMTRERLVQTNSVRRALALWLGMNFVAGVVSGPVHLLEVGASAGLNLLFDRYGYRVGGHTFGDAKSRVTVTAELRGDAELGAVDAAPTVASRLGFDLNPLHIDEPADQQWLRALVWPDECGRLELLDSALSVASSFAPTVRRLDLTTVDTPIDLGLPAGEIRVLFHSATRMHVPPDQHANFDRGVDHLGAGGPAYLITMEAGADQSDGVLRVRDPAGTAHDVAEIDGHVTWIKPLDDRT